MDLIQSPSEVAPSGRHHGMKCLEGQLELILELELSTICFPCLPFSLLTALAHAISSARKPSGSSILAPVHQKSHPPFKVQLKWSAPPWERPMFPVVFPASPFPAPTDSPL